jgi:hypothetical protein
MRQHTALFQQLNSGPCTCKNEAGMLTMSHSCCLVQGEGHSNGCSISSTAQTVQCQAASLYSWKVVGHYSSCLHAWCHTQSWRTHTLLQQRPRKSRHGTTASIVTGCLLSQVLACPPASCLAYGCPGYEFSTNGLRGCSIDTSAPAGSVFRVPFVVLDPSTGTGRASVERTVVITEPCGVGLYYCGGGCVKVIARNVPKLCGR